MPYECIDYSVSEHILTLALNRPEQMNAFTVEMAEELIDAFHRASEDDDVRAIVVTGTGRAFCAGMDLSAAGNVFGLNEEFKPTLDDLRERSDDPQIITGVRDTGGRVTLAIYECNKPVIAAINGAAVGIGATLTLAMDIRIASEKARIGFVFGKIGIVPEACSTWFLPRIVGISQALEWVYSGEILSAETAKQGGLVKAVVAADALMDEAYAIARTLVKRSPVATAITRHMMYRNAAEDHPLKAHEIESLAVFYTSQTDGKEGVAAFLEKREPDFKSKVGTDMPPFFPWWDRG